MPSRRRFIATSATAAVAASVLPGVGAEDGGRVEGRSGNGAGTGDESGHDGGTHPREATGGMAGSRPTTVAESAGVGDASGALRRARRRASTGQSVPFPAP